jgi:hypothetical protein
MPPKLKEYAAGPQYPFLVVTYTNSAGKKNQSRFLVKDNKTGKYFDYRAFYSKTGKTEMAKEDFSNPQYWRDKSGLEKGVLAGCKDFEYSTYADWLEGRKKKPSGKETDYYTDAEDAGKGKPAAKEKKGGGKQPAAVKETEAGAKKQPAPEKEENAAAKPEKGYKATVPYLEAVETIEAAPLNEFVKGWASTFGLTRAPKFLQQKAEDGKMMIEHIRRWAGEYGIPFSIALGLFCAESGFEKDQIKKVEGEGGKFYHYYGLGMLAKSTADSLEVSKGKRLFNFEDDDDTKITDKDKVAILDMEKNIRASLLYLHQMEEKFGSMVLGLVAYNFGESSLRGAIKRGDALPVEYVTKILQAAKFFEDVKMSGYVKSSYWLNKFSSELEYFDSQSAHKGFLKDYLKRTNIN